MKNIFSKWVLVASMACFACVAAAPVLAAELQFKLRFSHLMPAPHKVAILYDDWAKEVDKRTNGRVKVTVFPGATLTPAAQTYDSLSKGVIDVAMGILSYTPGRTPLSEVVCLPVGLKTGSQATRMADAYYKKFQPKELSDVKIFYLMGCPPIMFHTKTAVNKIEDLKGLRIKGDPNTLKIVSAAGASPTTIPLAETYDSVKRGLAEGIFLPVETLKGWKFGEVVKFTYENYAANCTGSFFLAMNKNKWNAMPKDVQQTIEKINEEWFEKQAKLWDDLDSEARDFLVKAGHTFVKATPEDVVKMRQRMQPILDKYVSDMKSKGLPGAEALKFCLDFVKSHP